MRLSFSAILIRFISTSLYVCCYLLRVGSLFFFSYLSKIVVDLFCPFLDSSEYRELFFILFVHLLDLFSNFVLLLFFLYFMSCYFLRSSMGVILHLFTSSSFFFVLRFQVHSWGTIVPCVDLPEFRLGCISSDLDHVFKPISDMCLVDVYKCSRPCLKSLWLWYLNMWYFCFVVFSFSLYLFYEGQMFLPDYSEIFPILQDFDHFHFQVEVGMSSFVSIFREQHDLCFFCREFHIDLLGFFVDLCEFFVEFCFYSFKSFPVT